METYPDKQSHPSGLYILSFTSVAERFSYYGMRAVLCLFMASALFGQTTTVEIYGSFCGLVYLTPLLGGYIADRYWGARRSILIGGIIMAIGHFLLFFSGLTVQQSIFVENGGIVQTIDNLVPKVLLLFGLTLIVIGNGFFKPTITSMVGDLYSASDQRKDAAYTIFYMGVNLGGFLAPLACGSFEGDWSNPGTFKWSFLIAGIIMLLSVLQFGLMGYRLKGPDGSALGLVPSRSVHNQTLQKNDMPFASKLLSFIVGVVLVILFGVNASTASDWIAAGVYAFSIAVPFAILLDKSLTRVERMRIVVIYLIVALSIVFWACFEQAGAALTLFAQANVDRTIGDWTMPSSWLQAVNPICVVLFAPVMVWMWNKLAKRGMEPMSIMKQALGLLMLATGYVVMVYATKGMSSSTRISMMWIILMYLLHSLGELALSPIGMSLVNKLSPARLASLMMGVWFLSSASANIFAGKLSTLLPQAGQVNCRFLGFSITTYSDFFLVFVLLSGMAGVVLAMLSPMMKRMSKGIL